MREFLANHNVWKKNYEDNHRYFVQWRVGILLGLLLLIDAAAVAVWVLMNLRNINTRSIVLCMLAIICFLKGVGQSYRYATSSVENKLKCRIGEKVAISDTGLMLEYITRIGKEKRSRWVGYTMQYSDIETVKYEPKYSRIKLIGKYQIKSLWLFGDPSAEDDTCIETETNKPLYLYLKYEHSDELLQELEKKTGLAIR